MQARLGYLRVGFGKHTPPPPPERYLVLEKLNSLNCTCQASGAKAAFCDDYVLDNRCYRPLFFGRVRRVLSFELATNG